MNTIRDFAITLGVLNLIPGQGSSLPFPIAKADISYANEYLPLESQSTPNQGNSKLGVVLGPDAGRINMLNLAIYIGMQTNVRVIDCGNRFDPHFVAYGIRRFTHRLDDVSNRTKIVRAFTCYEVVKALQEVETDPYPLLVIDMLSTFYDENVNDAESFHLLSKCMKELRRINESRIVAISLTPPPAEFQNRRVLNKRLWEIADCVLDETPTSNPIQQPSLF